MARTAQKSEQDAMAELLDELRALPPGTILTKQQVLEYVRRMPPAPPDLDTASAIREYRGPLPDGDAEDQDHLGRR